MDLQSGATVGFVTALGLVAGAVAGNFLADSLRLPRGNALAIGTLGGALVGSFIGGALVGTSSGSTITTITSQPALSATRAYPQLPASGG